MRSGLILFGRSLVAAFATLFGWFSWPFRRVGARLVAAGWAFRGVIAIIVLPILFGWLHFWWNAEVLRGFDVDWPETLEVGGRLAAPGKPVPALATVVPGPAPQAAADAPAAPAEGPAAAPAGAPAASPAAAPAPAPAEANVAAAPARPACGRSYIVDATARIIDFNVNQNLWISSNPFSKMGFFFLIDWERTKFLDNKAAFQRGAHQAASLTTLSISELLGRVRGTSQADNDLTIARGYMQFDPYTWMFNPFSPRPFGPTPRSSTYYRDAEGALRRYQERLTACNATFDERADNLLQFLDRIASDLGSTSATLLERAESHNSGWFDTRADDMFHFAKGQVYAYAGILRAARADFAEVVASRELAAIWINMEEHLRSAASLSPWVVSNGAEDGLIMPSHLTAMGFYLLRARSNLVELRSVLDR